MSEPNRGNPSDSFRDPVVDDHVFLALYGFSATYPVLNYLLNNLDVFTVGLTVQFMLIACLIPGATWLVLRLLARSRVPWHIFYSLNLLAAIVIWSWYMRPFLRQLPIEASRATGFDFGTAPVWVPLFIVVFTLGYRLRSAVPSFLSIVLILTAANAGVALYSFESPRDRPAGETGLGESLSIALEKKPNIYVLVVDGYLNRGGLISKELGHLDLGPELSERGFRVSEIAYSNYMPTVKSMKSFFDIKHHYYHRDPDWKGRMTGDNKLYSALRANDYTTAVAHPNDYLLRGRCESDLCYPAPDKLGTLGFMLSETLFYKTNFAGRTTVGMEQYEKDFYQFLEETSSPAVFYSHVMLPSHGPDGCSDPEAEVRKYAERLVLANLWLRSTIDKIESVADDPFIVIMGDHGAFLSDHCNRSDPDPNSSDAILDSMGILLATKWPESYDGRYDSSIHSPIDLSWYLLQFLSGDAMDEKEKPSSTSYFYRKKGRLVYEVVRDGKIVPNLLGVARSAY